MRTADQRAARHRARNKTAMALEQRRRDRRAEQDLLGVYEIARHHGDDPAMATAVRALGELGNSITEVAVLTHSDRAEILRLRRLATQ